MTARISRIGLVVICLAGGCAGPKVSRSITSAQLGSKYARLTGYFGTAKAAPGGRHEEETPGSIRHDVIRDEATLMSVNAQETCFDIVVRTESAHDEPIEQLAPACEIDGRKNTAIIEDEKVTVADYAYEGTREVVRAEGVAASSFVGMSIETPAERVFRVISREARVCCPDGGGQKVALALDNERREIADYSYKLTFEWTIR